MVSAFVYELCHEQETVSSKVTNDPDDAPGLIAKELFGNKELPKSDASERPSYDLQRAFECGNWGSGSSGPTYCAHRNENQKDRETFCDKFAGRGSWKEACLAGGRKCRFEYQGSGINQQMC